MRPFLGSFLVESLIRLKPCLIKEHTFRDAMWCTGLCPGFALKTLGLVTRVWRCFFPFLLVIILLSLLHHTYMLTSREQNLPCLMCNKVVLGPIVIHCSMYVMCRMQSVVHSSFGLITQMVVIHFKFIDSLFLN